MTYARVPEKEVKIDRKTEKSAFVNEPQKILPKQAKPAEKGNEKTSAKPTPKDFPKPAEKSVKPSEKSVTKPNDKVVAKTVEKNGTKSAPGKAPVRLSQRCMEKNAQKTTVTGSSTSNGVSKQDVPRNGNSYTASKNDVSFLYSWDYLLLQEHSQLIYVAVIFGSTKSP